MTCLLLETFLVSGGEEAAEIMIVTAIAIVSFGPGKLASLVKGLGESIT